jgi:hypothetical protein
MRERLIMLCEHLKPLDETLKADGKKETYRGQAWTKNCREWVYYDLVFNIPAIQDRFKLPDCVQVHANLDPRSGTERGLFCTACKDAVMGLLEGAEKWPV